MPWHQNKNILINCFPTLKNILHKWSLGDPTLESTIQQNPYNSDVMLLLHIYELAGEHTFNLNCLERHNNTTAS